MVGTREQISSDLQVGQEGVVPGHCRQRRKRVRRAVSAMLDVASIAVVPVAHVGRQVVRAAVCSPERDAAAHGPVRTVSALQCPVSASSAVQSPPLVRFTPRHQRTTYLKPSISTASDYKRTSKQSTNQSINQSANIHLFFRQNVHLPAMSEQRCLSHSEVE